MSMAHQAAEIAPGVAVLSVGIANVYFVGQPGGPWALIDTAVPNSADKIKGGAEQRFGAGARPTAILLTHGHPDHSGSAGDLAEAWDVSVYAHHLEMPYLTGRSLYPPSDPTVGGALAFLSRFFPSSIIDLGRRVRELPADGALPDLPGWEWHATPGHAPGHVAFHRASDKTLLAGDAFATVDLDSPIALVAQTPGIAAPPRAITCDWGAARASVERLAGLRPRVIGCGHGRPLSGPDLADDLLAFSRNFSVPAHGRYVPDAAVTDGRGIVSLPPPAPDPLPAQIAAGLGAVALAGVAAAVARRRRAD